MIKTDNKNNKVLEKLNRIEKLINLLNKKMDLNIDFNNERPNHYKIISRNKEFEFHTYDSVISALELICELNLILY